MLARNMRAQIVVLIHLDFSFSFLIGVFHVIVSIAVATDRVTGGRRDFAHVQFADAESARRARDEMRGQLIDGEAGTNGGSRDAIQSIPQK